MLFLSPLKSALNAVDRDLTLPLSNHLQQVVQRVAEHATELAAHCGRKSVNVKDVAQASSPFCLTCDPYDASTNTCNTLTTAKTQLGGAGERYEDWCGGNKQQCGISGNAVCLFSGGGHRRCRNNKNHKNNTNKKNQNKNKRAVQQVGATAKMLRKRKCAVCHTHHHHDVGGMYAGFCGQPFNLTQCTYSDAADAGTAAVSATCSGGKQRRTRLARTRHLAKKGGGSTQMYNGFCGTLAGNATAASQCMYGNSIELPVSGGGGGGGGKRRLRNRSSRKRRGGGSKGGRFDELHMLNKTQLKQHFRESAGMGWMTSASQLLQQVIAYHANDVVERVMDEKDTHQVSTRTALETVLATYK